MTHAKRDHESPQIEADTENDASVLESQQRLKAPAARGLSWGEDAETVLRPSDEALPTAAFRDDAPPPSRIEAVSPPPVRRARAGAGRWLAVAALSLLFCAGTYLAVNVARKLQPQPPGATAVGSAASLQVALREVASETAARVRTLWSARLRRGAPPPQPGPSQ